MSHTAMPHYPPLQEILPHRDSMLLLDRVLDWTPEAARCACAPRGDAWYAQNGAMPAWIGLELMAQTAGVHVGLAALKAGRPPRKGALLGTRTYRSTLPFFPAAAELTVSAHNIYSDESGLGSYDCAIYRDGTELATARLTVYEPEDFEQFIRNGQQA